MSGYFDRGAAAGGREEGYFDRESVTGPAGVGSATGGPGGGVNKDDIEFDEQNPNIARAVPDETRAARTDETAGVTSPERATGQSGTYPDIVEGSDSPRTGTSWGHTSVEADEADVHPNRNTGGQVMREDLDNVGSWSTIETTDSAGSPSGNS